MVYQGSSAGALDALGDATRRAVFELVRSGARPVGEIAAELPVSRPAVSQHLHVLKEAGLVRDRKDGTRRLYSVDPDGLRALREYVEGFWQAALEAYEEAATDREEEGR
ncbi:MAG TPA: metalloregulator ArsR/SmtB family transcription factor [Actinomycetota bacterium]|nr:metalloregulator ArsR/SmtB family transcription factor [Actinomycetota bacterium]